MFRLCENFPPPLSCENYWPFLCRNLSLVWRGAAMLTRTTANTYYKAVLSLKVQEECTLEIVTEGHRPHVVDRESWPRFKEKCDCFWFSWVWSFHKTCSVCKLRLRTSAWSRHSVRKLLVDSPGHRVPYCSSDAEL